MIDVFAIFDLPELPYDRKIKTADLKALVVRLRESLARRNHEVGDLFGSETDIWGFSTQFKSFDVLVGMSAPNRSTGNRWSAQVHLDDPGLFKATKQARLDKLKEVEWAVHDALKKDFKARDIEWHLGKGRLRPGQGQPTP